MNVDDHGLVTFWNDEVVTNFTYYSTEFPDIINFSRITDGTLTVEQFWPIKLSQKQIEKKRKVILEPFIRYYSLLNNWRIDFKNKVNRVTILNLKRYARNNNTQFFYHTCATVDQNQRLPEKDVNIPGVEAQRRLDNENIDPSFDGGENDIPELEALQNLQAQVDELNATLQEYDHLYSELYNSKSAHELSNFSPL